MNSESIDLSHYTCTLCHMPVQHDDYFQTGAWGCECFEVRAGDDIPSFWKEDDTREIRD